MKRCTYCGREHPDEATACSLDQHPLELMDLPPGASAPTDSESSTGWPPQVVVPSVLWLVVNILLAVYFSVEVSCLFGLLAAIWAAMDCSKFQSNGSRILGIAFKPVVVFATVAFFLWGFGFIWYLVMRNRVQTAPIDPVIASEQATAQQVSGTASGGRM